MQNLGLSKAPARNERKREGEWWKILSLWKIARMGKSNGESSEGFPIAAWSEVLDSAELVQTFVFGGDYSTVEQGSLFFLEDSKL